MDETKKPKSDVATREEEILKFWQENGIFEKSLQKESPAGEYVFYDGPPFATGLPHYGHILASTIKDIIPRYKTMQGFHVPRRWGWDCHGLPIENIVERELGFKHKKDIKEFGIAKFNERCREQVLMYAHEWERIIPRMGRFVDMEHAYRTMDKPFMESVWWVFKQLWDNDLIYQDYRSMHICPHCETTLSQTEVSEGYKDVKDIAVTVKFKLKNPEKLGLSGDVYFLAWTTTPWTLPGNVALAVGKDIEYDAVPFENVHYIVAKAQNAKVHPDQNPNVAIVTKTMKGSDLVGLEYEPPFDYYIKDTTLKNYENGWKVYAADFVTAESGTGIAHEAPAFGADDWELSKKVNLPFVQHVNMDGTMKAEITDFAGMEVKPKSEDDKVRLGTDIAVLKYLQDHGTFFSKENITHAYPHCWRCDTPLLNYATSSWFVSVTKIKNDLLKNAEAINWSPEHIKEGRFGNWLEGARDWSISRQRFWASVIPIWVCESCKKERVFGSVEELESASGKKVDDLHKHIVDEVTVPCECGGVMHRVPDVLDTWFDSGSMPYGEWHYPFENKEKFETFFPAQFIAEGIDQTRAWFYYLHVLAGGVFNKNAFQNVIVNGIVLAEDGKKMSKKLQNYPDPMDIVDAYGADALRLYMITSPIVQAENLRFSEKGVDEVYKKVILRLNNVVTFYKTYADESMDFSKEPSNNVLDRWIISRLNQLCTSMTLSLDKYELDTAARPIGDFVDDLSTWYIRRSRERFKSDDALDKQSAMKTTRHVLVEFSKLIAPLIPFSAEEVYSALRDETMPESVHLCDWPKEGEVESNLLEEMKKVRETVTIVLEARSKAGIKVRQPLSSLVVKENFTPELHTILAEEVNVKEVGSDENLEAPFELDITVTPELKAEGNVRDFIRAVQEARKVANLTPAQSVTLLVETDEAGKNFVESNTDAIKKPTNVGDFQFGESSGEEFVVENLKFKIEIK